MQFNKVVNLDVIAWIDNMTYRYDGNKVRKITDTNGDVISERTMDFPDLADLDVEYGYDRNGNMTWDANRGVHMQWDANNRLSCAYYNPGILSFTRSATGRRLSRSYSPNQSVALEGGTIKKGRSYADFPSFGGFDRPGQTGFPIIDTYDTYGSYEYENGAFSRLNTTTGYRDSLGVHVYVRDWQGNIRAVVRKGADGRTILEQATYYYPYGMPMAESTNPTANRYKYTGKELLTDHGVNIMDYGARMFGVAEGFFISVDALSATTPSISHYAMCGGDPINRVDRTGNKWENLNDAEELKDNINEQIGKLNNEIEQKRGSIENEKQKAEQKGKPAPEKKIKKLNGQIDELQARIDNLNQALSDIDLLGEHPIYTFKFEKAREGEAHHVKRNKDLTISIQTSCPALSIHEITHIRQSLEVNNHLRFENGYLNYPYYDAKTKEQALSFVYKKEIEAYQMQYSHTPNSMPSNVFSISDINEQYIRSIPPDGDRVAYITNF